MTWLSSGAFRRHSHHIWRPESVKTTKAGPSILRPQPQCAVRRNRGGSETEPLQPAQPERRRTRPEALDQRVEARAPCREPLLRDIADEGHRVAARACGNRNEAVHDAREGDT